MFRQVQPAPHPASTPLAAGRPQSRDDEPRRTVGVLGPAPVSRSALLATQTGGHGPGHPPPEPRAAQDWLAPALGATQRRIGGLESVRGDERRRRNMQHDDNQTRQRFDWFHHGEQTVCEVGGSICPGYSGATHTPGGRYGRWVFTPRRLPARAKRIPEPRRRPTPQARASAGLQQCRTGEHKRLGCGESR